MTNTIDSVLNPGGGRIRAKEIKELILEKDKVDVSRMVIQTQESRQTMELTTEQRLKEAV